MAQDTVESHYCHSSRLFCYKKIKERHSCEWDLNLQPQHHAVTLKPPPPQPNQKINNSSSIWRNFIYVLASKRAGNFSDLGYFQAFIIDAKEAPKV